MATVPEAKDALNRFKMEAAAEVGVQTHLKKWKMLKVSHLLTTSKIAM